MKFWIKLITLCLCWTITVLPVQNFYAQSHSTSTECCTSEKESECCEKDPIKKDEKHQEKCNDCCATAHHCPACFVYVSKLVDTDTSQASISLRNNPKFLYKTPFVYSLTSSIWQPPKIA